MSKLGGKVVTDENTAQIVLQRCRDHEGNFGIDVETSGLDPHRNFVIAYVLTFSAKPEDTYYVPIRCGGGGNLPGIDAPEESTSPIKLHWFEIEFAKIASYKCWNVIGHNLMFDLRFCAKVGIEFKNSVFSCTQVRQALVDEFTPSFGLDASAKHMMVTEKKGDDLYARIAQLYGCEPTRKEAMPLYWKLAGDDPYAVDYACGDGVSTWELYDAQDREIARQELEKIWKLERRTTSTLFNLQRSGIRIDVDYLMTAREKLRAEVEEMRKPFQSFVNKEGVFSERSAECVEKVYRAQGYTDVDFKRTPTGRFSFAEEWMETNETGESLLKIRKYANLDNSFITPALERHIFDGRIYPNYNQLLGDEFGTVSGRLSSNGPNIQQVPKHNEVLASLLRTAFIPDDGRLWSSGDYSQCEPRIFAEYTESDYLISGYMQDPPVDLYNALSKITGATRQTCKRLALALFYGAGNEKAAYLIGCSEQEAASLRNQVFKMIPEIKVFIKAAEQAAKRRYQEYGYGYVKSIGGRRLKIRDMNFAYKASNRIVQASNADLIKHGINEVNDYLQSSGKGSLLLTCHDSIDSQFDAGHPEVNDECMRIMVAAAKSEAVMLQIPQKVDNGVGRNWAEATFGVLEGVE